MSIRRIRSERGLTSVELLMGMLMSLVAAGAGLTLLGEIGRHNLDNERRALKVGAVQTSLERMTRELRQANWLQFTSTHVVDIDVAVRQDSTFDAARRHVRYDCSSGTGCLRLEGAPTSFPPPPTAPFDSQERVLEGGVRFTPRSYDPAAGWRVDYVTPTSLQIEVRVDVEGSTRAVVLQDGATLRNATRFREGA